MGFIQRNTIDVHLHSGICGVRLEERFLSWWQEYREVAKGCFLQGKYALSIAQVNHVTGDLHWNNVWAPKIWWDGCTKPTFFGYGELGNWYREVNNDVFLDITYWNYNTLFQVKVSLVLLQRDPNIMLTHTKRPNLTNCDAFMIHWHWARILSNQ